MYDKAQHDAAPVNFLLTVYMKNCYNKLIIYPYRKDQYNE